MKKLGVGVMAILLISQTAMAKNMSEKFGMGIGWTGDMLTAATGMIMPNTGTVRIGLTSSIVIEPLAGLTFLTISNGDSETSSLIAFTPTVNLAFLSHDKTNVYGKTGLSFSLYSPGSGAPSTTFFGLNLGLGLEHFVSDHFTINLSTLSGFSNKSVGGGGGSITILSISDQIVNIGFVWYY